MRASRNVISSFAASIWTAAVGLLVLPVYLRYIGVESYGLIGFLLTLQAWFLLLDMGLSPTTSREMARFSGGQHSAQGICDLLTSMEMVYAAVALLLALGLAAASRWLATDWLQLRTLSIDEATRALMLMAPIVAFQWMATLYRSAINGLQQQVLLGGLTVAMVSMRALATLAVLAWFAPTLEAFVLTQSVTLLIEAIALRWYLRRSLPAGRGQFSLKALKAVWQFAAGITAITVLATLLNQLDKLLLARLLTLEHFGHVSLAMTVIGAMAIVVIPVFNAAYPRFTELVASGQHDALAVEYHAFSQATAIAVLPIAATLALFSPYAVFAWTGDRQLTAFVAPIVSAWAVGSALNGLMHVPYALQLAVGWMRLSLILNAFAVAVMVPAILFFVPRYGAVAAGWIWTVLNSCYFTVGIMVMHRRVLKGEMARWYLRDVGIPCAATLAAILLCWMAQPHLNLVGRVQSAAFTAAALIFSGTCAMVSTPAGRRLLRACLSALNYRQEVIAAKSRP